VADNHIVQLTENVGRFLLNAVQLEKHHKINQEIINLADFGYLVKLEDSVLLVCNWHFLSNTYTEISLATI
jgi:hypothetical protein